LELSPLVERKGCNIRPPAGCCKHGSHSLSGEDVYLKSNPRLLRAFKPGCRRRKKGPLIYHTDPNLISVHELHEHTQDVFNLVARRAYQIFESRGHGHGNDRDDWFLAESDLLTPVKVHLSVSGDQLIARTEVPGFTAQEINVCVEPHRLSISGKTESHENHESGKHIHSLKHGQLMFRVIDLPAEVDISKTKATFNGGTLDVLMPKAAPTKSIRVETKPASPGPVDTSAPETGRIKAAVSPPVAAAATQPVGKAQTASRR
jgi:HSP20 family molecular chaperone IbpA